MLILTNALKEMIASYMFLQMEHNTVLGPILTTNPPPEDVYNPMECMADVICVFNINLKKMNYEQKEIWTEIHKDYREIQNYVKTSREEAATIKNKAKQSLTQLVERICIFVENLHSSPQTK